MIPPREKNMIEEAFRALAAETDAPCRCDQLRTPVRACGHRQGCPISDYVDLELARCGIV